MLFVPPLSAGMIRTNLFEFGGRCFLHEERPERRDALVQVAGLAVVLNLEGALRLVRDHHLGVVRHRRLALGAAEGPPALPAPVTQVQILQIGSR